MKDERKTRKQLIDELLTLRRTIDDLEQSKVRETDTFRDMFEKHSSAMLLIDPPTLKIIDANPAAQTFYGYNREEFTTKKIPDLNVLSEERLREIIRQIEKAQGDTYEFKHRLSDGAIRDVEVHAVSIRMPDGREAIFSIVNDITKRKRAEKALRESEERYRTILDEMEEGYQEVDLAGNFTFFNESFRKIFGHRREDLMGSNYSLYAADKEIAERIRRAYNQMYKTDRPLKRSDWDILRKDGQRRTLEFFASLLRDAEGRATGFRGIVRDVTDRRRAEEALRQSEREKSAILESISDMLFYVGRDMRVIYTNPAIENFFNLSSGHLNGKVCYRVLHRRTEPCSVCPAFKAMETGEIQEVHVSSYGRHWRLRGYPFRDENGEIIGAIEAVSDITDLRKAEERYRSIFENATEAIFQATVAGGFLDVNPAAVRMLGFSSPRDMMDSITDIGRQLFVRPQEHQDLINMLQEKDKVEGYEVEVCRQDGSRFWISINIHTVRDDKGDILYLEGTNIDITDRKRVEEELRESRRSLANIIDFLPDATLVLDRDGKVAAWNRAIEAMTGVKADEMLGKGDYEYAIPFYGERRPILIDLALHPDPEREKEYTAIRRTGDIILGEAYAPNLPSGEVHLSATASVLRDSKGEVIAAIECIRNNTERKRLEAQLQQAQKMEAIGTLAGGIAHDFNNLLMAIQGNASLMLMDTDSSDPRHEKLKAIEERVVVGADLTKQLLGFARAGKYEVKALDMNEIVDKSSTMFGRTKKEIVIHKKFDPALRAVDADSSQMEQVLINLYVNAWQAMPAGGHLYLETGNLTVSATDEKSSYMRPGRYIKISVTDSGVGMDGRTKERLFEPFFTTKEMGRGTGLGLAMVYGIVKGHNGYINVYSEKGKGTTFNIYLPASDREVEKKGEAEEEILGGAGTILLVDDEETVIDVVREMLEMLGYQVIIADSGREALKVYGSGREKIDLVILDMIMPETGGGETFDRLREINPDIKVLLSSGYSLNGEAAGIMARGCRGFIQKPVGIAELSRKVREVLAKQ